MAHLKRQKVPKIWPLHRKGNTFVVRPKGSIEKGIPLLVGLRDMLVVAKTKKEVKKAISEGNILINKRKARDVREALTLFDNVSLVPVKKSYKLVILESGRFGFEEIKDAEAGKKIAKVIDKKILKGKKIQINLEDGRNYLLDSKEKYNIGDSAVIDVEKKKIEEYLPMDKGSKVLVFEGKHTGKTGEIKAIEKDRKMVMVKIAEKEVEVLIKQVIVIK